MFINGLYPVVDSVAWIERLLEAGVRTLQLRIKDRRDSEVEDGVIAAIALGRRYHARLFINGLYPVVDSVAWIERLLEAGVRT
ncbi:thiamine phosphate synthase, partial [Escherichia coli]|uniref:thiamine phosphate synthase n=1 Tax=Escherichia coli TaxID=562 RepID=UPI00201A7C7C